MMKQARKSEVKAAAEALLGPVLDESREDNAKLRTELAEHRSAMDAAVAQVLKTRTELESARDEHLAQVQALRDSTDYAIKKALSSLSDMQAVIRCWQTEVESRVGAAEKTAQSGVEAVQRATKAEVAAQNAAARVQVKHKDLENLLHAIKESSELAQKNFRAEVVKGQETVGAAVDAQLDRVQGYADRIGKTVEALELKLEKELTRIGKVNKINKDFEQSLTLKFDTLKELVQGVFAKKMGTR